MLLLFQDQLAQILEDTSQVVTLGKGRLSDQALLIRDTTLRRGG